MDVITRATPRMFSNFEYGPILIGTFLGIFGCGAFLLGTCMYLDRYRQSPWFSKALLIGLASLNLAQTGVDCSRVVKILILHPSLIYFLDIQSRPEEIIAPVLSIIICTIVQLFLVDRCLLFTRINQEPVDRSSLRSRLVIWTIGIVLCSGVAVSFAGGLGAAIALHDLDSFLQAFRGFNPTGTFPTMATIWLSGSAATDILISGVIIYQLWNAIHDKKKLVKSRMLSSMMTVIIHGGVILTVLQIAILVTYFESNTAWADFPTIFISKVYSLTLLATWILPRQTHSIEPSREKALRKAHWSAPLGIDMPQAIDPEQGRYDRRRAETTFTETELSRKGPEESTIESTQLRSPRTFGEGLDSVAEAKESRDSQDLRYAGNNEKWRQNETQYDEDGKRIPGVLDLV